MPLKLHLIAFIEPTTNILQQLLRSIVYTLSTENHFNFNRLLILCCEYPIFTYCNFAIVNAEATTIRDVEVLRDGTTVMIRWSAIGSVHVLWSSDPEAAVADMELLAENDSDGIFAITDLQPDTRYYFYLRHQDDSGVRVAARLNTCENMAFLIREDQRCPRAPSQEV